MKTYHIKDLLKKDLLIVELHAGAKIQHFTFDKKGFDGIAIMEKSKKPFLIKGSYTLLGKPDEIREDDAKELVNLHESGYYKDYINGNNFFTLPSKSLLSAIESVIFWDVNPISKPDYFTTENSHIHVSTWSDFMQEWHEAEQKTFDRNRSIILAKQ